MLYIATWTCGNCGHSRHVEHKVPKIDPPPEPDWRALEKRARCTACRVRGQCTIKLRRFSAS